MHGETTEIRAFKRTRTGRMIQLKAEARSGFANTAPAEKKKPLSVFIRLPNDWKCGTQITRQNPNQSLGSCY